MKRKLILLLLPFLLYTGKGFAQVEDTGGSQAAMSNKTAPSTYIQIGLGTGPSNLRDFATSPLTYSGLAHTLFLSRWKVDTRRESEFGVNYSFGNFSATVGDESAVSAVKTLSIYYSLMYGFKKWNNDKWNFKFGGMVNASGNLRINPSFQNNAVGYEIFMNTMASAKVTRDISRKEDKKKKFLFVHWTAPARKRNLAFRLNVGVINNNARNGYVYAGQGGILNEAPLFSGYEINSFSGFRTSTALDYTFYLKNNNGLQFSYLWEANKTGGDLDQFEMAYHKIRFTLLFNTK